MDDECDLHRFDKDKEIFKSYTESDRLIGDDLKQFRLTNVASLNINYEFINYSYPQ